MKNFVSKFSAIAVASVIAVTASSAFAKTEGNYFGFDLSKNKSTHMYNVNPKGAQVVNQNSAVFGSFDDNSYGYGVNLKHAFNFDGVFISPGIFYDKVNTVATDSLGDQVKVNSRHGVKVDLGYDITDDFAAYVTGGVSMVNYEVNFNKTGLGNRNGNSSSKIVGFGFNYNLAKDWVANFEYNVQKINLNATFANVDSTDPSAVLGVDDYEVRTKITSMKLGLSYRF